MFLARNPKACLFQYRCREGTTLSAVFRTDQAQVWFGGEYYKLPQVPSGSGARSRRTACSRMCQRNWVGVRLKISRKAYCSAR